MCWRTSQSRKNINQRWWTIWGWENGATLRKTDRISPNLQADFKTIRGKSIKTTIGRSENTHHHQTWQGNHNKNNDINKRTAKETTNKAVSCKNKSHRSSASDSNNDNDRDKDRDRRHGLRDSAKDREKNSEKELSRCNESAKPTE